MAVEEAEAGAGVEVGSQVAAADAETPEAEVNTRDRAETVSPRYAVQVGAFENEERARSLLASVRASGFLARIVRVTGSELVRVRIGAFLDRTGAVELMDRVRRRGHEATIAVDVADEETMQ